MTKNHDNEDHDLLIKVDTKLDLLTVSVGNSITDNVSTKARVDILERYAARADIVIKDAEKSHLKYDQTTEAVNNFKANLWLVGGLGTIILAAIAATIARVINHLTGF